MDVVETRPLLPAAAWQEWWQRRAGHDDLAALASQRGFVLRAAELTELGITRSRARWAVARGDWTQVRRGVVAPIDLRVGLPDVSAESRSPGGITRCSAPPRSCCTRRTP